MREFARTERVGAELRRELSEILRSETKDPRLKEITVQEVRVSRDLSHAKIYFTCFPFGDSAAEQESLLNGRLAAFLRQALANRARLRTIPQLRFVYDESVAHGERLSRLIDAAVESDKTERQFGRPPGSSGRE